MIDELAGQFGLSTLPIREALRVLAAEGLVLSSPHSVAVVAPVSSESIREIFTILEGLETVAARTASLRMTESDFERLERLVSQMDQALEVGDIETWGEFNTQFHIEILDITGMPVLKKLTEQTLHQWDRVRRLRFGSVLEELAPRSQQEHHDMLLAMKERNLELLDSLVHRHNARVLQAYLSRAEHDT